MKARMRRRTAGRTILVAGSPLKVQWDVPNLNWHYGRHPAGGDRACWTDLLSLDTEQVSKQDYESESYAVVERAVLHYLQRKEPDDEAREVFVDDRLLQTVTGQETSGTLPVVTCFHKHFGSQSNHVAGQHREVPSEVLVRDYRALLERERDANGWDVQFRSRPEGL